MLKDGAYGDVPTLPNQSASDGPHALVRNAGGQSVLPHIRSGNDRSVATSVCGEAVEPAGATGGIERRLVASLAHMRRIPRHVSAPGAVRVAEHGARPFRREVGVRLCQRQAIRGPVAAGVIEAISIRAALGIRTGQNVVLILGALRPLDAWNDIALGVEHIRLLHVVAVA